MRAILCCIFKKYLLNVKIYTLAIYTEYNANEISSFTQIHSTSVQIGFKILQSDVHAVSYTHLDVYKRQIFSIYC